MKFLCSIFLVCACQIVFAQDLRSVLLQQLKNTHNNKEWFVPANIAVDGITPEQASWKDGSGNHSVGQLTYHLVFWNEHQLATFKGQKPAAFNGNNEETFDSFDKATWNDLVKRLNKVMVDLEKIVAEASDANLKEWSPTIANINAHNAYHTGQIIFVRKLQKSWDPEKGVK
ncbi:MAG TPA: DinB family protein [Cyclobacteriaceae bacterium]|nr:DinB family protein [Cyclobacteriaceae bacterium]